MANQGMYREAGLAVPGLPFPRARLVPLTVLVGIVAFLAIVMSLAIFVGIGGGMTGAWRLFRNGGWPMWFILVSDLFAPILIAVLGAFVLRGKRVPAGLLFVATAIPFVLGLFGAWIGHRLVIDAVSGESVDPEQKARILAEGFAETMSCDMLAGIVVCGAGIVASVAAASALASIDTALAFRGEPSAKPSSFGAIGAGACGGVWILATLVVGGLRLKSADAIVLLPVLPLLLIVPFAALAGRGAAAVRGWHDRAEGSRMAGALLVAGASAVLGVLALQRCIEASYASRALSAISGESVDPSQRLRILAYAVDAGRLAPVSYAVHAVLGTATFGLALAPALGSGKHPATPSAIVTVVVGLLLAVGTLAISSKRESVTRACAEAARASMPNNVQLPAIVEALSDSRRGGAYGTRIVVPKDATSTEAPTPSPPPSSSDSDSSPQYTIFADKAATIAMVRARLPHDRGSRITFVTAREHSPELLAKVGDLAGYLSNTGYVSATLQDDAPLDHLSSNVLRVVVVADDAIEIDGKRYTLPLPDNAETESSGRKRAIHYTFRAADSVDRVVHVIAGVERRMASQIATYDLERTILVDDPSRPKRAPETEGIGLGGLGTLGGGLGTLGGGSGMGSAPSKAPTVRMGATTVNGRLPPEVVSRIVRQSFGRFRLCYENGLRTNPKLEGRVSVKFVIGRTGDVTSTADGGSDMPDKGVVACVMRAIGNLTFPQPEGGIVTVVLPIVFAPAS